MSVSVPRVANLRLYSTALALALWALLWAVGVRGNAVIATFLAVVALSVFMAERERARRRRDRH